MNKKRKKKRNASRGYRRIEISSPVVETFYLPSSGVLNDGSTQPVRELKHQIAALARTAVHVAKFARRCQPHKRSTINNNTLPIDK
jgi:hypothetical protein